MLEELLGKELVFSKGELPIDIDLHRRRITLQAAGQRTCKCRLRSAYLDPFGQVVYCTFSTNQLVDPNRYEPTGWDYGYIVGGEWFLRRGIQRYFHPPGALKLSLGRAGRFIPWEAPT